MFMRLQKIYTYIILKIHHFKKNVVRLQKMWDLKTSNYVLQLLCLIVQLHALIGSDLYIKIKGEHGWGTLLMYQGYLYQILFKTDL